MKPSIADAPRDWLAEQLMAMPSTQIARIGKAAGLHPRITANAQAARPVATVFYLRLCAAALLNPAPAILFNGIIPPPADFDFVLFAAGFKAVRWLNHHSERHAADAIRVSASTICRLEQADAVQIGVVLRASAYLRIHPYRQFKNVPRETSPPSLVKVA